MTDEAILAGAKAHAGDLAELTELVREARLAAEGDSNDGEIAALQLALDAALELVPGWNRYWDQD